MSSISNSNDHGRLVSIVGENVARLRTRGGMSLGDLAQRAGVSKSTLSSIESGSANPSVETLVSISGALGVPFGELVSPREPEVQVQRADEGPAVEASEAGFGSRLLVVAGQPGVTEVYEATMTPGEVYQANPHLPGLVESVICVSGRIRVGPEDAAVELAPGDRATFAGDQVHTYEALSEDARAVLVLDYR